MLLRHNKRKKYVPFDLETEGLNLLESRPWQCSWLLCQGESVLEEHDRFIWWDDLRISREAAFVTRFDKKHYENTKDGTYKIDGRIVMAESPEDVYADFEPYLYGEHSLVGQNLLGFDVYVVETWKKLIKKAKNYKFVNRIYDTRALAIAIAKETKFEKDRDNFLAWQYRMIGWRDRKTKVSLAALLKHYQIEHDPKLLHDGLYDINMNFKVFWNQLQNIEL